MVVQLPSPFDGGGLRLYELLAGNIQIQTMARISRTGIGFLEGWGALDGLLRLIRHAGKAVCADGVCFISSHTLGL
jgi:hypothetical protein